MTKILKGSTCQPEEIHEEQRVERLQEFRTREFWNKPPLERSQITVEWLKKRIEYFHVTPEQVAIYTRMDLPRLKEILDDTAMLGLGEFCDIFHAISDANESNISPAHLYHHRLYGSLKKDSPHQGGPQHPDALHQGKFCQYDEAIFSLLNFRK